MRFGGQLVDGAQPKAPLRFGLHRHGQLREMDERRRPFST